MNPPPSEDTAIAVLKDLHAKNPSAAPISLVLDVYAVLLGRVYEEDMTAASEEVRAKVEAAAAALVLDPQGGAS